jgi:hypothetical protein
LIRHLAFFFIPITVGRLGLPRPLRRQRRPPSSSRWLRTARDRLPGSPARRPDARPRARKDPDDPQGVLGVLPWQATLGASRAAGCLARRYPSAADHAGVLLHGAHHRRCHRQAERARGATTSRPRGLMGLLLGPATVKPGGARCTRIVTPSCGEHAPGAGRSLTSGGGLRVATLGPAAVVISATPRFCRR